MASLYRTLKGRALALALSTALVFVIVAALRLSGLLQWAELQAYDWLLQARAQQAPPERGILIVEVTEQHVLRYGWPLPDGTLDDLLNRLLAMGADIVGVDVYRDHPVGSAGDRLARTIADDERIIWVSKFGGPASVGVAPPAVLRGTDRVGFADMVPDPGGIVRRGLLFLDDGVNVELSFALRLALRHLAARGIYAEPGEPDPSHLRLGPTTLPPFEPSDGGYVGADARGYQYLLNYPYGRPAFPKVGLHEVLEGRVPPADVAGRLVLVGVSSESVKDFFDTPFSHGSGDRQPSTGVDLHAEMTDQIIRHGLAGSPPTRSLSETLEAAWLLVWCAIGTLIARTMRSPALFAVVLGVAGIGLALGASVAFAAFWWIPVVPPMMGLAGTAGLGASYMAYRERLDRANLMRLFSRHVSGPVAEDIWRHRDEFLEHGRPMPQQLQATVLFADIKGFTRISETTDPTVLMEWLSHYMESMAHVIAENGGIVDKFVGDAVMAVFGVPIPCRDEAAISEQARKAAECALSMRAELDRLNDGWRAQGRPVVAVRVGIHTGDLTAGSLGGVDRMEYTVIGDTVNIAARLEAFADSLSGAPANHAACTIVLSETTRQRLGQAFVARRIGETTLKGKARPVTVFQLIDRAGAHGEAKEA